MPGLLLVILIASSALIAGCTKSPPLPDDFGQLPDFNLTERSGKPISRQDLAGKTWVAAFIFTRCAGPCTQISGSMAQLQSKLSDVPNVRLVSFSVDPEFDTPAVLTPYAERFGASPERWLFATGEAKPMYELLRQGFKVGVEQAQGEDRKPGNEVTHSTKLVLVDRQGHHRGYFDGLDQQSLDQIIEQVRLLEREKTMIHGEDLPGVNAVLNASSAILLVAGYFAIRRRAITVHKTCMLSALGVSAVFLSSYLYYHFVVRGGSPTRFNGEGWILYAYRTILLTHTILAVTVAPLALTTAYFGLSNKLLRHMKLAKWTLPIWLYVSITGVVVYWMLYRM